MLIRIGNAIQQAIDKMTGNMQQRESGLYVPPDLMAGRHYGGFSGYEPWIQACIRAACRDARGVGEDELSEITALVSWLGEDREPIVVYLKHNEAIDRLRKFMEAVGETAGTKQGLDAKAEEQYRKTQGTRQLGTLVVLAMDFASVELSGKLMTSVSAWRPASVEEAKAMPKQQYVLG